MAVIQKMKNLFNAQDYFRAELSKKYAFLFLDYDGTLAPIVKRPDKAVILKDARKVLSRLSGLRFCKVAIISGREIDDVKRRVGLKNVIYAGNHGLQIQGPKLKFTSKIHPQVRASLYDIKRRLRTKLRHIKGVLIEDKGLTLSVHYRMSGKKDVSEIKSLFHEVIMPHLVGERIKIRAGKMVLEARPPIAWDKGKVVLWLLSRQQFALKKNKVLPIYFGDDLTDEDAFRALRNKGITVFVGKPRKSYAQYYVRNTHGVLRFLRLILNMQKDSNLCQN